MEKGRQKDKVAAEKTLVAEQRDAEAKAKTLLAAERDEAAKRAEDRAKKEEEAKPKRCARSQRNGLRRLSKGSWLPLLLRGVSLADRELLANHGERAEQLLDDCPADLRSWEWYYLKHKCHLELRRLQGHSGAVLFVVFSPDGKRLASAGADHTVRLWDVPSGKEVGVLRGHTDAVHVLAFPAPTANTWPRPGRTGP